MTLQERAATMKRDEIVALLASHEATTARNAELQRELEDLKRQVAWFKQQLFGSKSERRVVEPNPRQLCLGEWPERETPEASVTVGEHVRRRRRRPQEEVPASELWFDPETVPIEEIRLEDPEGDPDGEVIGEKVTLRLAQRPASYVIVKYVRLVRKRRDGSVGCAPAPRGVLGKSCADVSLLAGLAVDKFCFHLPLYRQHRRMEAAGVRLARSTLTDWLQRTAELLEPVYEAQFRSVLASRVLAMDETPIKAGRDKRRRRMRSGYFWPVFGDRKEVVFPFAPSRSAQVVHELLGRFDGVLLVDGYSAYDSYASAVSEVTPAQCWSHVRRKFVQAEGVEPELTETALEWIRKLYLEERKLQDLGGPEKLRERGLRCRPLVEGFFAWLEQETRERALLPSNPWTQAAEYTLSRKERLRVFLQDPNVPLDTNHLEREIRVIAGSCSYCTPYSSDWKQRLLTIGRSATRAPSTSQGLPDHVAA